MGVKAAFQNLTSQRLRLRLLRADDAPAFFRYVTSDLETVRYVQWPVQSSVAEAEALLATFIAAIERGEKFYFAAEDAGGSPVAFASMKIANFTASIGFVVAATRRRQGYAAELITLLTEVAFERTTACRVEGLCDVDNVSSARAMMKAGFAKEEVLAKQAIHPNVSPEPRDLVRYAITKEPKPAAPVIRP